MSSLLYVGVLLPSIDIGLFVKMQPEKVVQDCSGPHLKMMHCMRCPVCISPPHLCHPVESPEPPPPASVELHPRGPVTEAASPWGWRSMSGSRSVGGSGGGGEGRTGRSHGHCWPKNSSRQVCIQICSWDWLYYEEQGAGS